MKNEFKVHDLGQPDWVQLGIEVDAWDYDSDKKTRGVLIGYDSKSKYPYRVDVGCPAPGVWKHAEPVRRWVPQPGELVAIKISGIFYLRVSTGDGGHIRDGEIGGVPVDKYFPIYRLPEGVPLHELSFDPAWWEQHAEKYEGGE
jgi:hypothetical protein